MLASHAGVFRGARIYVGREEIRAPLKTPAWEATRVQEILKNAGFSFTCGRTQTEVFEYDDVIHYILLASRMIFKDVIVFLSF